MKYATPGLENVHWHWPIELDELRGRYVREQMAAAFHKKHGRAPVYNERIGYDESKPGFGFPEDFLLAMKEINLEEVMCQFDNQLKEISNHDIGRGLSRLSCCTKSH